MNNKTDIKIINVKDIPVRKAVIRREIYALIPERGKAMVIDNNSIIGGDDVASFYVWARTYRDLHGQRDEIAISFQGDKLYLYRK